MKSPMLGSVCPKTDLISFWLKLWTIFISSAPIYISVSSMTIHCTSFNFVQLHDNLPASAYTEWISHLLHRYFSLKITSLRAIFSRVKTITTTNNNNNNNKCSKTNYLLPLIDILTTFLFTSLQIKSCINFYSASALLAICQMNGS